MMNVVWCMPQEKKKREDTSACVDTWCWMKSNAALCTSRAKEIVNSYCNFNVFQADFDPTHSQILNNNNVNVPCL